MNTSEPMIQDYDAVLDARYGEEGTPERLKFEEDAYAYYTGMILRDARKDAKVSQAELATAPAMGFGRGPCLGWRGKSGPPFPG